MFYSDKNGFGWRRFGPLETNNYFSILYSKINIKKKHFNTKDQFSNKLNFYLNSILSINKFFQIIVKSFLSVKFSLNYGEEPYGL